jgi:hypothetical protein
MTRDEKILKLGKMVTDRVPVILGAVKLTTESPEYIGINAALRYTEKMYDTQTMDDALDVALSFKVRRVPQTLAEMKKRNPKLSGERVETQPLAKGLHYIGVALNEVPLFIKKGKKIPLCRPAMRTRDLDLEQLEYIG